jgi:hypothetical protein
MQSPEQQQKKTKEFNGRSFEIDEVNILNPLDIQRGDQVIIVTESEGRFMVRRSESREGALMISTEMDDGFNKFYSLFYPGATIAEIGKVMSCKAIDEAKHSIGDIVSSSAIRSIEIRRGLDKAINEAPENTSGSGLAQMLKDQIRGKR